MPNIPTHLVCKHLEKVSWVILERFPQIIKYYTSRWPGIYVLYRKGRPYYVGLATDLNKRFPSHRRGKHAGKWDSFSLFLTLGDQIIKDLEALLLHIYTPPGNSIQMKFRRSENLKRSIKRMIKKTQDDEWRDILEHDVPFGPR